MLDLWDLISEQLGKTKKTASLLPHPRTQSAHSHLRPSRQHELWALLNFLLPDIFSSAEQFDDW